MPGGPTDFPQFAAGTTSLTAQLSPTSAIVFTRTDGAATVGLRFGRVGVGPDVSVQPAAVVAVIDDQARAADADRNRWNVEVLRALRDWEPTLAWCDLAPDRLVAAVGAFTHPLLTELYQHGCAPVGEVPRWASPALRTTTAADAARLVAGDRTNRRLTRALAAGLRAADDTVDLAPLALAVAASGLVTVDELANTLDGATHVTHRSRPPTVDEVRTIRTGLDLYPPPRRARLLVDAARHHDPVEVAAVFAQLNWVSDLAPRPLPVRVRDLAELCTRLVPVLAPPAPRPAPDPPPPRPAPRAGAPVPRRQPAVEPPPPPPPTDPAPAPRRRPGRAALTAPHAPARAPERWPVPEALLPISGHTANGLTFCVPTSATELTWWSRQLQNCLDGFSRAAAHERSWLVGIRRDGLLIGCIEVCPSTRRLRQAQGPRNRALPNDVYDTAIAELGHAGILNVRRRG